MDQQQDVIEGHDIRELLTEILKGQEQILRRIERLEEALMHARTK